MRLSGFITTAAAGFAGHSRRSVPEPVFGPRRLHDDFDLAVFCAEVIETRERAYRVGVFRRCGVFFRARAEHSWRARRTLHLPGKSTTRPGAGDGRHTNGRGKTPTSSQ